MAARLTFLQSQAIADSTRRSYQAGIRRYFNFCASRGWPSFPATETTLRFFAAYLADQVSFKTIKLYMAGIRFAHTENSLPDPFLAAPLLHLLLRGIKRTLGLTSRQRLPITMTLLRQIKEELARAPDYLPTDKLMLWSAFTLAFYGFLRSSEFTSPSASQFNPLVHLSTTGQAGWGPHPTLVYSLLGGYALHSLPRPLPCRVCRFHPHCIAHC